MSRRTPLIHLVDGALPARRFSRLRNAVFGLGRERLRASYQTTFWFALDAPPGTLVEAAILRLLPALPPARRARVVGVEWWLTRMRTSNVKVDFHRDRDNGLFEATGRTVSPVTSSVLYVTDSVGGLLAVSNRPPDPSAPACAPPPSSFEVVAPRPNRFVFFDGRLTHGVLDARNEVPWRRLPVEPRWRVGIAINFWQRQPLGVPTFHQSTHYRALALGPKDR